MAAPNADNLAWKIQPNGKGPWWTFSIYSPSAQVESSVTLMDDVVIIGRQEIPGFEKPKTESSAVVNLDEIIDSVQAMRVAYESGVNDVYSPEVIRWDPQHGQPESYSWNITFWRGIVLDELPRIIIDAKTGEVIRNDFLAPPELEAWSTQLSP